MSLYTVSTGAAILALDTNQLVNVLQVPASGSESGKYFLAGNGSNAGDIVSCWITLRSRGSTPVSVSIDTATQAPAGGANAPVTGNLDQSGFQIFFTITGASSNARCGGNWTVNF